MWGGWGVQEAAAQKARHEADLLRQSLNRQSLQVAELDSAVHHERIHAMVCDPGAPRVSVFRDLSFRDQFQGSRRSGRIARCCWKPVTGATSSCVVGALTPPGCVCEQKEENLKARMEAQAEMAQTEAVAAIERERCPAWLLLRPCCALIVFVCHDRSATWGARMCCDLCLEGEAWD